jgi:predicted phosphodiesterase
MAVRFVVLADTHYHPAAPKDFSPPRLLTRGPEILAATVPAVNALSPEFIVHVGDLLCGGGSFELSRNQYDRSLRDVTGAFDEFTAPLHCVPGNHDCNAQHHRFCEFARAFDTPEVFDVIDDALRAADAQAEADGVVLFLILHSWIHPGVGADPSGIITKAKRLQATMAACSTVAATFSGHRHANRVRLFRDYVCIDTACLIGYPWASARSPSPTTAG